MYDVLGKVVFESHITQPLNDIKISDWKSGMYSIEINQGQQSIHKKIIIE
jgi:hypothetical protein